MRHLREGRPQRKGRLQALLQTFRRAVRRPADMQQQAADRHLHEANVYLAAMAGGLGVFILILYIIRLRFL